MTGLCRGYSRSVLMDFQQTQILILDNRDISFCLNERNRIIIDTKNNKELEQILLPLKIENTIPVFSFRERAFEWPSDIENSVLFFSESLPFRSIIEQLTEHACQTIAIIIPPGIDQIDAIIKVLNASSILYADFFYKGDAELKCSISSKIKISYYKLKEFTDYRCCGKVGFEFFSQSINHWHESQHHNTCLNRKLCIDKDGYIKNCPHMNHHYGHISTTGIAEVVKLPEFQQWWHIKKDEIDVCCDCEFRHLCTDCRALIKDPGNVYSQPAKCTYNPYICKWAGEEGYVPVEECGTYSRETGFVPDEGKISRLNKEVWGDW